MKRRWRNYLLADMAALAGVAAVVAVVLHQPVPVFPQASEWEPTAQMRCTETVPLTLSQMRRQKQPVKVGLLEGRVAARHARWQVTAGFGRTQEIIVCEIRDERNHLQRRVAAQIGSRPASTVLGLTLCSARDIPKNVERYPLQMLGPGVELALTLASPRAKTRPSSGVMPTQRSRIFSF